MPIMTSLASARPGSPLVGGSQASTQSLAGNCSVAGSEPPERKERPKTASVGHPDSARMKKGTIGGGDSCGSCEDAASSSDESEQSSASARSDEDAPVRRKVRAATAQPRNISPRRQRVVGRQWVASLSARSNQDGQRRFEERAARQMRAALARRVALPPAHKKQPPGGVYARLEAEWRERHVSSSVASAGAGRSRSLATRARAPANKYSMRQ